MKEPRIIIWDGFLGKNTKADEYDIGDLQASDVRNVHITAKHGSLVKARGYHTAVLNGRTYKSTGLPGSINCLAELIVADTDADSPYYICQAGTGGKFYIWDTASSSWVELSVSTAVDTSAVSYIKRNNAVLFMTGSSASTYPVLVSYIGKSFTNVYKKDASLEEPLPETVNVSRASLENPDDYVGDAFMMTLYPCMESGWTHYFRIIDGNIGYRVSFQYDNGQWSKPSSPVAVAPDYDYKHITVVLGFKQQNFNRRITGVKVFRAKNYTGTSTDDYRLIRTVLFNDKLSLPSETFHVAATTYDINKAYYNGNYFQMYTPGSNLWDNISESKQWHLQLVGLKSAPYVSSDIDPETFDKLLVIDAAYSYDGNDRIIVLGDDDNLPLGDYYVMNLSGWHLYNGYYTYSFDDVDDVDEKALPEMWNNLGYAQNDESSDLHYELACIVGKRQFIARYWDGNTKVNNVVRASSISTEGSFDYDVYHLSGAINVQDFGISEIVALTKWQDRLVILGAENIVILDLGTGETLSWSLHDTFCRFGAASPHSVVNVMDSFYFIGKDAPAEFRNLNVTPLTQLESRTNFPLGVTNISEAVGGYDPKTNEILWSFPTNSRVIVYNVAAGEWTELSTININHFTTLNDSRLLAIAGKNVYEFSLNDTTFAGSAIVPFYRSKTIKFSGFLIQPVSYEIRYNSNSTISFKLIGDGNYVALPDQGLTGGRSYVENFLPAAKLYDRIAFEITTVGTNTVFELKSFALKVQLVRVR